MLLMAAALAGPHLYEVGAKRAVKVDLYGFGQTTHAHDSAWNPALLHAWSGVLDCRVTKVLTELCRFRKGRLDHGVHIDGEPGPRWTVLPLTADIELTWTPTGRLERHDIRGDRQAFWTKAGSFELVMSTKQRTFSDDKIRRIGRDMELALLRGLAAALEIDLSPKGEAQWTTKKSLWAGRRYAEGVVASARFTWTTAYSDTGFTGLEWSGKASEATDGASHQGISLTTDVVGEALLDPERMLVVQLYTESRTRSSSGLDGHTRWIATSKAWSKGDSIAPTPLPASRLD